MLVLLNADQVLAAVNDEYDKYVDQVASHGVRRQQMAGIINMNQL